MSMNLKKSFRYKLFDLSDQIWDFEIDDAMRNMLCFREDLIVSLKDESTSDTKPLGRYCISIECIGTEGKEFMVQVLSSLSMNDSYGGLKVLNTTTEKFHCLEEKRTEYVQQEDGLREQILYIGLEDDVYHLEGEESCPCNKSKWQKDLPLCSTSEMISEGANVLLMRYLALKNFHGSLSFQSVMIGGQLTTCNYNCSKAQSMKFNDHVVEVYTIERRIHEECGLVHNILTLMSRSGYILKHDWIEVPYLLEINSFIDPNKINQEKPKFIATLRSRWSSDVQMMSLYLDKKTCKMAQQIDYLNDHPEIKQLISDYTQTLLAVKPINVLSFTMQHFAAFAKYPDPSEIGGSGESNLDVISQLSKQKPKKISSTCGICFDCVMSEQLPLHSEDHSESSGLQRDSLPVLRSPGFSFCSVLTKCPSHASCVRKLLGPSDTTTYSDNLRAFNSDTNKNSICNFYPDCKETCEGCRTLRKPCRVHRTCPECPGCHKVCSEIAVCPNCETCKIEILPDV